MSKFNDLEAAFHEMRDEQIEYRNRCREFLNNAARAFCRYIEAPNNSLQWVPAKGEAKPGSAYSVAAAYYVDDDGFSSAKAVLQLPSVPLSFVIKVEFTGSVYRVKFGNYDAVIEVASDDDKALLPISEWLWLRMKECFSIRSTGRAVEDDGTNKVGFDL